MPQIELAGKTYEVDEDGFLQELDKWSKEFAQAYAKEEGIEGHIDGRTLEDHQLSAGLFPEVRHRAHDPKALQGQRHRYEEALRALSHRAGQGGLQAGRTFETDRMRLKTTP